MVSRDDFNADALTLEVGYNVGGVWTDAVGYRNRGYGFSSAVKRVKLRKDENSLSIICALGNFSFGLGIYFAGNEARRAYGKASLSRNFNRLIFSL